MRGGAVSDHRQQRLQFFDRQRCGPAAHILHDQRIDYFAREVLLVRVETGDRVAGNLPRGASGFGQENPEPL